MDTKEISISCNTEENQVEEKLVQALVCKNCKLTVVDTDEPITSDEF